MTHTHRVPKTVLLCFCKATEKCRALLCKEWVLPRKALAPSAEDLGSSPALLQTPSVLVQDEPASSLLRSHHLHGQHFVFETLPGTRAASKDQRPPHLRSLSPTSVTAHGEESQAEIGA